MFLQFLLLCNKKKTPLGRFPAVSVREESVILTVKLVSITLTASSVSVPTFFSLFAIT